MSEDFLARAERIFARMKMSSRVVEPELPPVVEGVKDERRYVPQAAAPVGAAPEPEPELVVAKGEVVVVNDKFGIRLTDVVSAAERVNQLA